MAEPNTRLVVTGAPEANALYEQWRRDRKEAEREIKRTNRALRDAVSKLRNMRGRA